MKKIELSANVVSSTLWQTEAKTNQPVRDAKGRLRFVEFASRMYLSLVLASDFWKEGTAVEVDAKIAACERINDAHDAAIDWDGEKESPTRVFEVSDADHELLCAAVRAFRIPQELQVHFGSKLRRFERQILTAQKAPETV